MFDNQKLAELLVKRVFSKHDIEPKKIKLNKKEKKQLKSMIDDIKGQVESFLENPTSPIQHDDDESK